MTYLGKPLVCWWQCDWRPSGRTAQSDTINAHVPGVCVIQSFIGPENPLRNFTTRVTERRKPCIRFFFGGGGGGGVVLWWKWVFIEILRFCIYLWKSEICIPFWCSWILPIPLRGSSCRLPSFLIYANLPRNWYFKCQHQGDNWERLYQSPC